MRMSEVVGEDYGDEREPGEDERVDENENEGTQPGEGKNDKPSTTGTHRGWGDPQPGEKS
jgi:hypothetical protein